MTAASNEFYDALAATYDEMIPFAKRLASARALVRRLLAEAPVQRAVDVATGTGLFALALAEQRVATIGVDLSAGMVEQAAARARELELTVDWRVAPMQELASVIPAPVDLVLCLGNSLPHLLDWAALDETLGGFAARLAPGGRLILQLLNYNRVLAKRERIVAVTREGDHEYVRFYDFLDEHLRFNVLAIDWREGKASHRLESVLLHPWQRAELGAALQAHGFTSVEACGGLAGEPFHDTTSEALVLVARR